MKIEKIMHAEQIGGPSEGELLQDSFNGLPSELQELLKRAGQTSAKRIDAGKDAVLAKKGINPAQRKLDLQ